MLEAILWDVDGVLVDSEAIYFQVVQETFRPYGIIIAQEGYLDKWIINKTGPKGVIEEHNLEERFKVTLKSINERKEKILFNLIDEKLEMIPHAMDILDYFAEYPMGVVSSAEKREVQRKLGKFNLLERFCIQITADDVQNHKPDPEPYQKGMLKLAAYLNKPIFHNNLLVIEDNPSGVRSAKAAGCKVIAYPNGFTERFRNDMKPAGADAVVSSLKEINDELIHALFNSYY